MCAKLFLKEKSTFKRIKSLHHLLCFLYKCEFVKIEQLNPFLIGCANLKLSRNAGLLKGQRLGENFLFQMSPSNARPDIYFMISDLWISDLWISDLWISDYKFMVFKSSEILEFDQLALNKQGSSLSDPVVVVVG